MARFNIRYRRRWLLRKEVQVRDPITREIHVVDEENDSIPPQFELTEVKPYDNPSSSVFDLDYKYGKVQEDE